MENQTGIWLVPFQPQQATPRLAGACGFGDGVLGMVAYHVAIEPIVGYLDESCLSGPLPSPGFLLVSGGVMFKKG